ncbi:RNA polymerase sigma factor [Streptomyces gobiensis]|uniref:RNA polymerase sigma factor n=1 Tax=Streptomyces gobiensis TaxID=2875706 RepID=UPI001E338EBA|nr:RNA polymerase sigma factor [Streptomyces gobiensis]UGY90788.1 RNA polymerase sigma factor [Streptomyces gobiensis]
MRTGGVCDGDAEADSNQSFDTVFCSLLPRLYRRATLLSGGTHSAEDLVHDTYLKLAARPGRLPAHPEPYAYAFATLMSVVRDAWRRDRKHVLVADVDVAQGGWDGGLEQRTAELETIRLLGQLSVRQAGVVILVDLDGYTIDQAASILRVHRGTAARQRTRALDKLRRVLNVPEGQGRSA